MTTAGLSEMGSIQYFIPKQIMIDEHTLFIDDMCGIIIEGYDNRSIRINIDKTIRINIDKNVATQIRSTLINRYRLKNGDVGL